MMNSLLGWDTETNLIQPPLNIVPSIVCSTWAAPDGVTTGITTIGDGAGVMLDHLRGMVASVLQRDVAWVIHNAAFDICVALRFAQEMQDENLTHDIWEVLEQNLEAEWTGQQMLCHDTAIREALLMLSTGGTIDSGQLALAKCMHHYYGEDRRDEKVTMRDGRIFDGQGNDITGTAKAGAAWRLRYEELRGIPGHAWPAEAVDYAIQDAIDARKLALAQHDQSCGTGHRSMRSESLQIYSAVALRLTEAHGFRVDQAQAKHITAVVDEQLAKLEPELVANGVIRSNGSVNAKLIQERVEILWAGIGREPMLTEKGGIATDKETMEILADLDPLLSIYAERQRLAKLRDAFLPIFKGDRAYTSFDILKETGRTSSKATKLYHSFNSQQMPRKTGLREVFLPEDGYVIGSTDYAALELCSVAQVTFKLFGHSVHREKINAGYDLHSYLGAAICRATRPELVGYKTNMDDAYAEFVRNRKMRVPDEDQTSEAHDKRALAKAAKNMRNMAKPVGLGYPGGLGTATMVAFAKTTYGVDVSEDQAAQLKELWFDTYPEMIDYFTWVRDQIDDHNHFDGKPAYCYETAGFGRWRAGCSYCAAANGMAMQSLSADGAKRGVAWLGRAMAGGLRRDSPYCVLDVCYPLTFIHDENLIAYPDDPLLTIRAAAVESLMILAMREHMPDVRISAEPAIMRRWMKVAEPEWRQDEETWDQARRLLYQQYPECAEAAWSMFSRPDRKILVPYDDVHGWKRDWMEE